MLLFVYVLLVCIICEAGLCQIPSYLIMHFEWRYVYFFTKEIDVHKSDYYIATIDMTCII